jgi:hypothetical protein
MDLDGVEPGPDGGARASGVRGKQLIEILTRHGVRRPGGRAVPLAAQVPELGRDAPTGAVHRGRHRAPAVRGRAGNAAELGRVERQLADLTRTRDVLAGLVEEYRVTV